MIRMMIQFSGCIENCLVVFIWIYLALLPFTGGGGEGICYRNQVSAKGQVPYFNPTESNYTFHRGELAILHCSIQNLGTKTVIWRREPSDHPLTIGKLTYIDDDRYQVNHVTDKPEWNLLIKNVSPEDSGKYECQVAAKDRTLRKQIYLHVRGEHSQDNPSIIITGTFHVDKGQPINLACNATGATTPPDHIDWFKDGIKVTTDSRRKIDIHKRYSLNTRTITSNLTIKHSDMPDTGTYVCRTSDLQVTSVKVNILNAEKTSYKREPLSSAAGRTNGKTNNLTDTRNSVQSIFQNTVWITVLLTLLFSVHGFSGTVIGRFEPK